MSTRTSIGHRAVAPFFDEQEMQRGIGGQIDWTLVGRGFAVGTFDVVINGAVAVNDVVVNIDALAYPLKKGDTITFAAANIHLKADAAAGATSLSTEKVTEIIADNAIGNADKTGPYDERRIKAGTVMARTAGGKLIPRVSAASGETASEVLASDADERSNSDSLSGYGTYVDGILWQNMMPDAVAGVVSSTYKTELTAAGCRFQYQTYSDSRLS